VEAREEEEERNEEKGRKEVGEGLLYSKRSS
jgi:hypothetical protein